MVLWSWFQEAYVQASLAELDDASGRFQAFVDTGHQRHADAVAARIGAVRVARQVAARQNRHIIFGVQAACELGVGQAGAATSAHR